jgi:hypothetical protein
MRLRRRTPLARFAQLIAAMALHTLVSQTAQALDTTVYAEDSVVEILTVDEDGESRETKIWIVVVDGSAYIRTNDSRWLANIRRNPAVQLRTRGVTDAVLAEIVDSPEMYDRVEEEFKIKYGLMQRVMSAFRLSRPTLMRIAARADH